MTHREESRKLKALVQIDDAYLGGEHNSGKTDRGSENKQAFLVSVETDDGLEHPRHAVIEPVRRFDNASIFDWAKRRLASGAIDFGRGASTTCFENGVCVAGIGETSEGPQTIGVDDGSTSCSPTSSERSAASTIQSTKPSTRGAIWAKPPTASTSSTTHNSEQAVDVLIPQGAGALAQPCVRRGIGVISNELEEGIEQVER